MAMTFWDLSDPTYKTPSLISRVFNVVKKLGQFILPNMYPEQQHLSPPERKQQLIQSKYGMYQQGDIYDLENSKVIEETFKERTKRQREQYEEESAFEKENNEGTDDQSGLLENQDILRRSLGVQKLIRASKTKWFEHIPKEHIEKKKGLMKKRKPKKKKK